MQKINPDLLKNNIEKIAFYDFNNNKGFGAAYCVMQGNEVIYEKYFGHTSAEGTEPVAPSTMFRLASMTKPVTAVATLILVERGLLSLGDRVADYLPEFSKLRIKEIKDNGEEIDLGEAKTDITLWHLLTHTSGFGSNPVKIQKTTEQDKASIANYIRFNLAAGLDFEPGTRELYSGTAAFDVLVNIIEKVTGMDYLSFLKKEIFEPCGMENTTFVPSPKQWGQIIAMHNKVDGKNCNAEMKENCVFSDFPCTHFLGGAGLASTLADYSKFAKMLLNKGKTPKKQILKEETLRLMHTLIVPEEIKPHVERWGLGVRVIVKEEYKTLPVGTFGWSGAYGSHFWVDPINQVAAVFMKNSLFDGGAGNESARYFEKAVKDSFVAD